MTQLSLLDSQEGERQKAQALLEVEAHASEGWKLRALRRIAVVAKTHQTFTSDLLWDDLDQPTEPRALGAILRNAGALNLIEPTEDWKCSALPHQHRRPLKVWRSKVYKGEG